MKRLYWSLALAAVFLLALGGVGSAAANIHNGYTANTDACASCHSTHTAPGKSLLKWSDVTTACLSCHDGSVSSYNVVDGTMNGTSPVLKLSGGLFGLNAAEDLAVSRSNHSVKSNLKTGAAPGGSGQSSSADSYGVWTSNFTCASCHTPHGQGGNERILSADPNGVAIQNPTTNDILVALTATVYQADSGDWIKGYPYSKRTAVGVNTNDDATTGFGWNGTDLVLSDAGDTRLVETTDYTLDYRNGKVTLTSAGLDKAGNHQIFAAYVRGVRVVLTIQNKLTSTENVLYDGGLNKFCAACHTDYNTSATSTPGQNQSGTYVQKYRHKVGDNYSSAVYNINSSLKYEKNPSSSSYNVIVCLTCHFGHGTDQTFMGGSESEGSSVLKRKPNMGVCETCHQKGPESSY